MRLSLYSSASLIFLLFLQFTSFGQTRIFTRGGKSIEIVGKPKLIDSRIQVETHLQEIGDKPILRTENTTTDVLTFEDKESLYIYTICHFAHTKDTFSIQRLTINIAQLSKIKFTKLNSYVAGYKLMLFASKETLTVKNETLSYCLSEESVYVQEIESSIDISMPTYEGMEIAQMFLESKMSD
jgi:CRISPR/Cas system CMR-associated protein Cmr3 (group 5 of RAMP superfamily)